jgi:formimidoylglutamate deiminase
VEVGGVQVVRDGRHRDRDAIATRYRVAMQKLLA